MADNNKISSNRRKLYDVLTQHISNLGTFDEFNSRMVNESNRRKVYNIAQEYISNTGTWDEFTSLVAPRSPMDAIGDVMKSVRPTVNSDTAAMAEPQLDGYHDAAGHYIPGNGDWNRATAPTGVRQEQAGTEVAATPAEPDTPRVQRTEADRIKLTYEMMFGKDEVVEDGLDESGRPQYKIVHTPGMREHQEKTSKRVEAARRVVDSATPEGRRMTAAAEGSARMAGAPTRLAGISAGPAWRGGDLIPQGGQEEATSAASPKVHGVRYVGGKAVTEWLMPDGSLTTDLREADAAERTARLDRQRHKFAGRMAENGLDPEKAEDVQLQEQMDMQAPIYRHVAELWNEAEARHKADMDKSSGEHWDSYAAMGGGREMRTVTAAMDSHDREKSHLTRFDLQTMMEHTWNRLGKSGRKQLIDRSLDVLSRQNPVVDKGELIDAAKKMARSLSDNAVYQYAVSKNMPESTLEYFGRQVADMNLVNSIGKGLARIGADGKTGDLPAYEAAMGEYGKDHRVAQIGGTVLGMAVDPTMWVSGGVGSLGARTAVNAGGRIVAQRAANGMTRQVGQRLFSSSLGGRIITGAAGGASNFATYEMLKEGERQFVYGGVLNPETLEVGGYSAGDVLKAGAHGLVMGGVTGTFSPLIGNVADKTVKATTSTAGKAGVRLGEVAVSALAEGTVFSIPEWISGEGDAFDVWTDNMAMMIGFKAQHGLKSAPRVIAGLRPIKEPKTQAERNHNRQSFVERLRNSLDASQAVLSVSKDEREELRRAGYGELADLFGKDKTREVRGQSDEVRAEDGIIEVRAERLEAEEMADPNRNPDFDGYSAMERLMEDGRVSEATRAKMYYILTGRMLPMSSVVGWNSTANEQDGTITVSSINAHGGIVTSRTFKNQREADAEMGRIQRQAELNTVDIGEQYREAEADGKVFEAAVNAVSPGADHAAVKEIYDKVKRGDEDATEQQRVLAQMLDEAIDRNKDAGKTSRPETMRSEIKKETGVDVDTVLRKQPKDRSKEEQDALQTYMERLYPEEARRQPGEKEESATRPDEEFAEYIDDGGKAAGPGLNPDGTPMNPVGRATMKVDDREVEVLGGRIVMTDDGAMVDSSASDKSIIIRDVATGKVEMVSPDAILTYEDAPADAPAQYGDSAPVEYGAGRIVLRGEDGTEKRGYLTGGIVTEENYDDMGVSPSDIGKYEYYVEGGLDGLHYATREELDGMVVDFTPEEPAEGPAPDTAENASVVAEDAAADAETAPQTPVSEEGVIVDAGTASEEPVSEEVAQQSALSQIPTITDARGKAQSQWTAVEPGLAWDGLVERTADEEMAQTFADNKVDLAQKALDKAQRVKPKAIDDLEEFMESERQRKQAIAEAQAQLDAWKRIAAVAESRRREAGASGRRQEDETYQGYRGNSVASVRATAEIYDKPMTSDEAKEFIAVMEDTAGVADEITLTAENWDKLFGESGIVATPVGEVKMGEHQFLKMMRQGREGKLGMIKPTLENPDAIVEDESSAIPGTVEERGTSYVFIKAFKRADGTRYYYFTSITVSKDGKEVVVSNQEKSRNRILRLLTGGSVIWRAPKDAATASVEQQGLDYVQPIETETATKGSGITPQSTSISSKVYSVPAVGGDTNTDTSEVDSGQTEGVTAPAGNSSQTSERKDSESLTDEQISSSTSSEAARPITGEESLEQSSEKYAGALNEYLNWINNKYGSSYSDIGSLVKWAIKKRKGLAAIDRIADDYLYPADSSNFKRTLRRYVKAIQAERRRKHNVSDKIEKGDTLQTAASQPHGGIALDREIYNRHTTDNQPTEADGVSQGTEQSGTTEPSRMNTPKSGGKDNDLPIEKQILVDKVAAQPTESESIADERQGDLQQEEAEESSDRGAGVEDDSAAAGGRNTDVRGGNTDDAANGELAEGVTPSVGPFGEIYTQFKGKPQEAVTFLLAKRSGEAIGALHHKEIGDIDLVWGKEGTAHSDGYGLAKLAKFHPEVLFNLQEVLNDMVVTKRSTNRVQLESDKYQAAVRLTWDDKKKTWLLTMFEKKNSVPDNTTDTVETLSSNGNDTATPENTVISSETATKTEPQQPNNAVSSDSSLPIDEQSGTSSIEPNGESAVSIGKDNALLSEKQISEEESLLQPSDDKGAGLKQPSVQATSAGVNTESTLAQADTGRLIGWDEPGPEENPFLNVGTNKQTEMSATQPADNEEPPTIQRAIDAASAEVDTNPTEAQKEAGNYKKGHITIGDFDITIENPAGSVRSGVDASGNRWETAMANAYGYIKGTESVDGDHIDVFLHTDMDEWNGRKVYVVDQTREDGAFDEHKVMLGFNDGYEAMQAYLANYDATWAEKHPGLRISEANIDDFNKWIQSSHRKTKPFADYRSIHELKVADYDNVSKDTYSAENLSQESGENLPEADKSGVGPKGVQLHNGTEVSPNRAVYEAAKAMVEATGVPVHEVGAEDVLEILAQKETPLTGQPNRANEKQASGSGLTAHSGDSSSNATDSRKLSAKLNNDTQSAKNKIKKYNNGDFEVDYTSLDKTFESLGSLLSMRSNGGSRYALLGTDGGSTVAIRLSDHRANGRNFGRNGADENLSIVIERRQYDTPQSEIEFTEAVIPLGVFKERPEAVVAAIVGGVESVLSDGEFTLPSDIGHVTRNGGNNIKFSIKTYHGTGADFEAFDFSHMGEGEGAQAFGWGGYVTEVPGIGRFYAESTSKPIYKGKGIKSKYDGSLEQFWTAVIAERLQAGQSIKSIKDGILTDLEQRLSWSEVNEPESVSRIQRDIDAVKSIYKKDIQFGSKNLYTVEIPDDNGRNYIDWTKRADGKFVELVAGELGPIMCAEWMSRAEELRRKNQGDVDISGFKYDYRSLAEVLGSAKAASELLSSIGFTGIKYPSNYLNGGIADKKNYVVFNEADLMITDHARLMGTPHGVVYGWAVGGEVYLNRDAMNPETPLHEYTHLWDAMVQREKPELWQRGKELMKETPLWDEVRDDPAYSNIRDDEDAVASEVHSRLTGERGAEILDEMIRDAHERGYVEEAEAISLVAKLGGWLREMFASLKETLGRWSKRELRELTAEDFVNLTLRDLAEGLNPNHPGKELVTLHNISESKLRKALKAGGLANPSMAIVKAGRNRHDGYGSITLVAPGALASKRSGRNAGTWAGDAWTPMYPPVEREQSLVDRAAVVSDIAEAVSEKMRPAVSRAWESHMAGGNESGLAFWFLSERGEAPDVMRRKRMFDKGLATEVLGIVGERNLTGLDFEEAVKLRDLYVNEVMAGDAGKYLEFMDLSAESARERLGKSSGLMRLSAEKSLDMIERLGLLPSISRWVDGIRSDERIGERVDEHATSAEASRIIGERGLDGEFERWIDGLDVRYGVKERLFAGYTPGGTRRYVDNNVGNASKLMKAQGRNGSTGISTGFSNFVASVLEPMTTHEHMRRQSGKLQEGHGDTEDFDKKWSGVYFDLAMKCQPDAERISDDYGFYRLGEAAGKKNPAAYLKAEYGVELDAEDSARLSDMIRAIREERPVKYFETKFERPVGFEEFAAAVVPEGIAPDLEQALKSAGLRVEKYFPKKEGDRQRAVALASNIDGVRFHAAMSRRVDDFDSVLERAVAGRGIVTPGLSGAKVDVVEVSRHDFGGERPIAQARTWAKAHIVGEHELTDSRGMKVPYSISARAVDKYLSATAIGKSDNLGVHLSVLKALPDVIGASIEAEVHPDYKKGDDGKRSRENGYNPERLVHRFYGAAIIDGKTYRVKTTIYEHRDNATPSAPHSYEVTKVEMLDMEPSISSGAQASASSNREGTLGTAKLLKGVEKSYDEGVKLLDAGGESRAEAPSLRQRGGELAEYEDLMKKEMAEKEAKYADIDATVEAASNVEYEADDEEDEEDGKRYRMGNDSFNEQLERYIDGKMPASEIMRLGTPRGVMKLFLPDMPIVMRQRVLTKASVKKHNVDLSSLMDMPEYISTPIFVFKRSANTIGVLTEMKDRDGKNVCVAIELKAKIQNGQAIVEVNDIRSAHGRREENVILPIIENGTLQWVDKEKGLEWLSSASQQVQQEITTKDLDSAAKIVKEFENPTLSDVESENGDVNVMRGHGAELAARLHTPVRFIEDVSEISNESADVQHKKRTAKGWYDTATGEVVIVLPNCDNVADVESTIFHEVVGHKGMREIVGEENYDNFCDEVYGHLKDDLKRQVDEETTRRFINDPGQGYEHHRRVSVDEMFGRMSEKGFEDFTDAERGIWAKLKAKVLEAINKFLGSLKLPKWVKLGDNELRYMLWRSHERLRSKGDYVDMARDAAMRVDLKVGSDMVMRDEVSRRKKMSNVNEARLNDLDPADAEHSAKVVKRIESTKSELKRLAETYITTTDPKGFLTDLGHSLGAIVGKSGSGYRKFELANGNVIMVRISTHNVNSENARDGEPVVGIVIKPKRTTNTFIDDPGKRVSEFVYFKEELRKAPAGTLSKIAEGISEMLDTGIYKDKTGLARENHSGEIRFRDTGGETDDIWSDRSVGLEERITNAAIRLAGNQAGDLILRNDAMRAVTNNLQSLLHTMRNSRGRTTKFKGADRKVESKVVDAMNAQAMYDRSTVKRVTDLARILIQHGYLSGMTGGEVKRLLSAVKDATAMHNPGEYVEKILDIMVDNHLRNGGGALRSLLAIRGSKVDARGVEVQGELDVEGQRTMEVVKKAMPLAEDDISERIAEALNRMGDSDRAIADQAAIEHAGLNLALDYVQNIAGSKAEEAALRDSLKTAREDRDAGRMTDDAYRQFVETAEDAIRKNKIERAEAYFNLVGRLSDSLRGSMENAKVFREAEKARVREIHHNANSDMEGRPANEHHRDGRLDKFMNNGFVQFMFAPLATFDQMLRVFGNKSANGEGYLWNRFMRGWVDCREKELLGVKDKLARLDAKAAEVFGKGVTWGKLIRLSGKMKGATVSFQDGGEMREHKLTQGNLMYIYMVDKMSDGRMKLRRMGITESDVADIESVLDPRFRQLADWLQEEFLVDTRNEYNETHKRMFGASMAAIENYFPLKILANARIDKEEDVNQPNRPDGITTKTGSIIKRRANNLALDITGADALSVILDHITQMEHWNAYAEWNRDLNTLRTYKRFRNQVINMTTVYGGGRQLWSNFNNLCLMAAGEYRPPVSKLNKNAVSIARGVTAAKVSLRMFTALKQLLSAPAYAPEVSISSIASSITHPYGDFKWCMENLPIFRERWHSRISGDPRLLKSEMDWNMWRNRIMEKASRFGMTPNAFIDAVTVAIGARAIYDTRLAQYKKEGYPEDMADKRAKQDATILFNQTQQSSESPFLSTMQVDRDWLSSLFTVFRNSAMSYTRQEFDALRNLKRNLTPGQRAESVAFMKKQIIRDWGIDPDHATADEHAKAEDAAKSRFRRQLRKDIIRLATFGFILELAWNLGAYLPYMFFGNDNDEKDAMWDDALTHAYFGSVEGLTGGDVMSGFGNMAVSGEWSANQLTKDMPLASDISSIRDKFIGDRNAEAFTDIFNLLIQSGIGMNPQSITDAAVAFMDACGDDPALSHEAAIFVMRVLQVPQSQLDKMYFDEIGLSGEEASKLTPQQLAERYATYKVKRGTPFAPWSWDDGERIDRYRKAAEKKIKERLENQGRRETLDAYADFEERYKAMRQKAQEAKKLMKFDYLAGAQAYAELQQDPDAELYRFFGRLDKQLKRITKMYMEASTAEEAAMALEAVTDYRAGMVEALEAETEAERQKHREELERLRDEFVKRYRETHAGPAVQ